MRKQSIKSNLTDAFIRHVHAYSHLFNDFFDESSDILNTFIEENNSTVNNIKNDLDLFPQRVFHRRFAQIKGKPVVTQVFP